jgi:hypothetical protein
MTGVLMTRLLGWVDPERALVEEPDYRLDALAVLAPDIGEGLV